MLGNAGKIFGGSSGAFDWMSVCLGCVGCSGSERIDCRAWNASAPGAGSGFDASFRTAGLGARRAGRIAGKSFAGPYQEISVLGAAETVRAEWMFQIGGGKTTRSACKAIATTKAYFGKFWSIQQFRKNASEENSFGAVGPLTNAIRLEENSSSVPFLSRSSRGVGRSGEASNEMATFALSCK